jgi:cell division protein FtsX
MKYSKKLVLVPYEEYISWKGENHSVPQKEDKTEPEEDQSRIENKKQTLPEVDQSQIENKEQNLHLVTANNVENDNDESTQTWLPSSLTGRLAKPPNIKKMVNKKKIQKGSGSFVKKKKKLTVDWLAF